MINLNSHSYINLNFYKIIKTSYRQKFHISRILELNNNNKHEVLLLNTKIKYTHRKTTSKIKRWLRENKTAACTMFVQL